MAVRRAVNGCEEGLVRRDGAGPLGGARPAVGAPVAAPRQVAARAVAPGRPGPPEPGDAAPAVSLVEAPGVPLTVGGAGRPAAREAVAGRPVAGAELQSPADAAEALVPAGRSVVPGG